MKTRALSFLFGLAAVVAACANQDPATDDSTTVLLRDYSCPNCRIVAESVAFIGHPDDTVMVAQSMPPATDSRGRFYLANSSLDRVQVFAPSGRLLQVFGESGDGPGEFSSVRDVVSVTGDTLLVFNGSTVHIVSPEFKHLRQFTMRRSTSEIGFARKLGDGTVLIGQSPHGFIRINTAGDTVARVRVAGADTTRKCYECRQRRFEVARSGKSLWSGTADSYVIDKHSLDGALEKRFVREADWFKPWPADSAGPPRITDGSEFIELFTRPRMLGMLEDENGLLWTFTMFVPDLTAIPKSMDMDDPKKMAALYAAMRLRVEVIDPVKGQVLAGTTFERIAAPLASGLAAFFLTDDSGDSAWRIARFRIEGR